MWNTVVTANNPKFSSNTRTIRRLLCSSVQIFCLPKKQKSTCIKLLTEVILVFFTIEYFFKVKLVITAVRIWRLKVKGAFFFLFLLFFLKTKISYYKYVKGSIFFFPVFHQSILNVLTMVVSAEAVVLELSIWKWVNRMENFMFSIHISMNVDTPRLNLIIYQNTIVFNG